MVRFSTVYYRFRLLSLLTAAILCLVPALSVRAGSYVYGSRQRTVNAGVLFSGTASDTIAAAPDPAPYVFYVLNRRSDIKPFGWNIVNPRAPSAVSTATATRWGYTAGQSVTTNMAAYWEVPLSDTSADQLRQYDVLYLPLGGTFVPSDVEKLRRFVDGGGQLWIESAGTIPNFPDVKIAIGPAAAPLRPPVGSLYLCQPILSQPFLLSGDDLFNLGNSPAGMIVSGGNEFSNIFGSALNAGTSANSEVSVAQYGAGQVIASALNIGAAINAPVGVGAFCGGSLTAIPNFYAARAQDLRFVSNLIAGSGVHSSENKNGHQNAASNDLASFSPAWSYPKPGTALPLGTTPPPGAAVWGNYVFVTDASGILHAFDAYPAESLTGTASVDDGIADFSSASPTAYDEVWNATVGAGASAPTVASYGGNTYVFVEKADGSVLKFSALPASPGASMTGTPLPLPTSVTPGPTSYSSTNAPAPTFFEGRIYAGQPNSDLFVYKLPSGPGYRAPVNPGASASGEPVTASPAVGLLSDGILTNNIVAYVPTSQNMYTVFLGARADEVQPNVTPPTSSNLPTAYTVNRGRLRLSNLKVDMASSPVARLYQFGGTPVAESFPGPADFGTVSGVVPAVYADYDADLYNSYYNGPSPGTSNGQTLNLNQISDLSAGSFTGGNNPPGAVSAPALDRAGNLYYTVNAGGNSYLYGVHQDPQFQNVQIKFRFRIPTASDGLIVDADNVSYAPLVGFNFVGAPVVDDQGFVYVAAVNGTQAAVLCFNTTQAVYADFTGAFDPGQASYTQPDEFNANQPNTLRPGPLDATLKYGQFSANSSRVTFFNFGIGVSGNRQIAGNLSEPQPVSAVPYNFGNNQTQTFQPVTLSLHTNLSWFTTPFAVNGPVAGITKVGTSLFLTDGSWLYKLPATSSSGKVVPLVSVNVPPATLLPQGTSFQTLPTSAGIVASAPSVGNGVLVVNGTNGVSALTQQFTLIADNNRILETDSSGQAVWAVDSTNSGTAVVDFNHPVALSQVTANDYLVADTGNNRCVRFDRAGDVLWELTKFNDPSNLLAAGQPMTLSQPTSVEMRRYADTSAGNPNGVKISYLIADSGNYRVLEVTDTYSVTGGLVPPSHVLTWASHTHDKQGRSYRYGSATYFGPNASPQIVGLVTNTRVSSNPTTMVQGPASGDAPGGCMVALTYDTAHGSSDGLIAAVYSSFQANNKIYQVRNPRYIGVYTPPAGSPLPYSVLYADDNGAFDLTPTASGFAAGANSLQFLPGLSSDTVNTSYHSMALPAVGVGAVGRANIPFIPSSVQRLNNDPLNPKYLITQTYSQSELGTTTGHIPIGGEIFEVDGNTAVGGFSGSTLSRPGLTGPLTQPTFAIRPQQ